MKRFFGIVALAIGLFCWNGMAQVSSELPKDFVFKTQAPERSAWTIDCVYQVEDKEAQAGQEAYGSAMEKMASENPDLARVLALNPSLRQMRPRVQKALVTKTGKDRREEIFYMGGKKEDRWRIGSIYIQKNPFTGKIFLQLGDVVDPEGDFPELAWISAKNYRGVEKVNGREVFVFESRQQRGALEDPRLYVLMEGSDDEEAVVRVRATLDPRTLLPISLSWDGQTRNYVFGPPPAASLVLPPDLTVVVKKSVDRAEQATRPLSPP